MCVCHCKRQAAVALFAAIFAFFKGGEAVTVARTHGARALASFIVWPDAHTHGLAGGGGE